MFLYMHNSCANQHTSLIHVTQLAVFNLLGIVTFGCSKPLTQHPEIRKSVDFLRINNILSSRPFKENSFLLFLTLLQWNVAKMRLLPLLYLSVDPPIRTLQCNNC